MFHVGQRVKAHLGKNLMSGDVQAICIGKVGVIAQIHDKQEPPYCVKFEDAIIYLYADEISPVTSKVV